MADLKDDKLIVKINSETKERLNEIAERLDRPAAQLVCEAVKEIIARHDAAEATAAAEVA